MAEAALGAAAACAGGDFLWYLTAIAGPNGAGKSTLLKALIGDLPLASGTIDLGRLAPTDIGYLPQAAEIDRRFPLMVGETVLLGAWRQAGAFGAISARSASGARRVRRKILTSHDAFGYLGRDYGIEFLSPLGLSTETEASAADVAKLIDQVKKENVKIYFIETSTDPRLVQQIATATGAHPGGKLCAEALSPPDGPAPTCLRMVRYNIDRLVQAMAGERTPTGWTAASRRRPEASSQLCPSRSAD